LTESDREITSVVAPEIMAMISVTTMISTSVKPARRTGSP
jgi:hypothetical protein